MIEFLYHCEAQELMGLEYRVAGDMEISLECMCDYDWATDTGASAYLTEALLDDKDVIDDIGMDLRLAIEERALEVVIERAEHKEAKREDVLRGRTDERT